MSTCTDEKVELAVDMLLHGYREELNLYSAVRDLSLAQYGILNNGADLLRFGDLLDEKEDVLRLIGQIDSEMAGAKALVAALPPSTCPRRRQLAALLDRVTDAIEETRAIERDNVSLLDRVMSRPVGRETRECREKVCMA